MNVPLLVKDDGKMLYALNIETKQKCDYWRQIENKPRARTEHKTNRWLVPNVKSVKRNRTCNLFWVNINKQAARSLIHLTALDKTNEASNEFLMWGVKTVWLVDDSWSILRHLKAQTLGLHFALQHRKQKQISRQKSPLITVSNYSGGDNFAFFTVVFH